MKQCGCNEKGHSMKKIIVYGLGGRCNEILEDEPFKQMLIQRDMEIVAFADGDVKKRNTEIRFAGCVYRAKTVDECLTVEFDYIFVTSNKYFQEIKDCLIEKGVAQNAIYTIDEVITVGIYHNECYEKKAGVEIGGPSAIFKNVYKRCTKCDGINFSERTVWWEGQKAGKYVYEDRLLGNMMIEDATDLRSIADGSYDFVLSSNNLEHIANPLKALFEFNRIVRPGGAVLIAVPIKEKTFDHRRPYTSFEHILSDYINNVCEDDLSHLDEIISLHDYDMDLGCGGRTAFIERARNNYLNRCLHQHVFSVDCLQKMFQYIGFEYIEVTECLYNYVVFCKKCY